MEKRKELLIGVIIVVLIVLLGVGGVLIYNNVTKDEDKTVTLTIWENDDYSIVHKDKSITLVQKDTMDNELIADNVKKYEKVALGSDICEGDSYVIILKEDGTLTSISIDALSCGNEVKVKRNIGNLNNVTDIYANKKSHNEYEPEMYEVYAKTNDNSIMINNYLN